MQHCFLISRKSFSLRSCRSLSVIFFDFSQGNLENFVGNLEGIFRGFFLTHRTKAQTFRGKFRSIFRKKIRGWKKIFRAKFTLQTCHLKKSMRFLGSAMGIAIANHRNRCDFGALSLRTSETHPEVPGATAEEMAEGPTSAVTPLPLYHCLLRSALPLYFFLTSLPSGSESVFFSKGGCS